MFAVVEAATGGVVIVKRVHDSPSGTVTLAGTWAICESELASVTVTPPLPYGAYWRRTTAPRVVLPPMTDEGLNDKVCKGLGLIVKP